MPNNDSPRKAGTSGNTEIEAVPPVGLPYVPPSGPFKGRGPAFISRVALDVLTGTKLLLLPSDEWL
jgi:hypothetical protein